MKEEEEGRKTSNRSESPKSLDFGCLIDRLA